MCLKGQAHISTVFKHTYWFLVSAGLVTVPACRGLGANAPAFHVYIITNLQNHNIEK